MCVCVCVRVCVCVCLGQGDGQGEAFGTLDDGWWNNLPERVFKTVQVILISFVNFVDFDCIMMFFFL